jgi:two-component system sensor histidine kinase YesM
LAILDDYLVIQKYRYGDSVVMEKKIADEALLDTLIPRFVLQPLIENAIFHGIEPKGAGLITVEIKPEDHDVVVSVTDNGVGMSAETIAGLRGPQPQREDQGMFRELGIHNVDERLRCAFGESRGLSVASEEGSFPAVTFKLPRASFAAAAPSVEAENIEARSVTRYG